MEFVNRETACTDEELQTIEIVCLSTLIESSPPTDWINSTQLRVSPIPWKSDLSGENTQFNGHEFDEQLRRIGRAWKMNL